MHDSAVQWHPVLKALKCGSNPRNLAAADAAPRDSQAVVSEDQLEIPALHWHAGRPWQAGNSLCGRMLQHALVHCEVHPSCKCSRELEYTCANILLQGMAGLEVVSCTISGVEVVLAGGTDMRWPSVGKPCGSPAPGWLIRLIKAAQRRSGQGRTSKTYGGTPCSSGGKGMPCSSIEPRQPCSWGCTASPVLCAAEGGGPREIVLLHALLAKTKRAWEVAARFRRLIAGDLGSSGRAAWSRGQTQVSVWAHTHRLRPTQVCFSRLPLDGRLRAAAALFRQHASEVRRATSQHGAGQEKPHGWSQGLCKQAQHGECRNPRQPRQPILHRTCLRLQRSVSKQEWEKKMSNVRLKKEDMNVLIMNFLVTEVRLAHARASIVAAPGRLRQCCMLSTWARSASRGASGWGPEHCLSAALLLVCSALC